MRNFHGQRHVPQLETSCCVLANTALRAADNAAVLTERELPVPQEDAACELRRRPWSAQGPQQRAQHLQVRIPLADLIASCK